MDVIGPAILAEEEEGQGMPGMPLQGRRGGMIAGDDDDVGLQGRQAGDERVDLLDDRHLAGEISVLAGRVGAFDMDVEERVVLERSFEGLEASASPSRSSQAARPCRQAA